MLHVESGTATLTRKEEGSWKWKGRRQRLERRRQLMEREEDPARGRSTLTRGGIQREGRWCETAAISLPSAICDARLNGARRRMKDNAKFNGAFVSKFPAELAFRWDAREFACSLKRSLRSTTENLRRRFSLFSFLFFFFFFFLDTLLRSLDIKSHSCESRNLFQTISITGRRLTEQEIPFRCGPATCNFSRNASACSGMFRFQNAHQTKQRLLETKHGYRARGYNTLKAFF